jgi:hypothetical protein
MLRRIGQSLLAFLVLGVVTAASVAAAPQSQEPMSDGAQAGGVQAIGLHPTVNHADPALYFPNGPARCNNRRLQGPPSCRNLLFTTALAPGGMIMPPGLAVSPMPAPAPRGAPTATGAGPGAPGGPGPSMPTAAGPQ